MTTPKNKFPDLTFRPIASDELREAIHKSDVVFRNAITGSAIHLLDGVAFAVTRRSLQRQHADECTPVYRNRIGRSEVRGTLTLNRPPRRIESAAERLERAFAEEFGRL